MDGLFDIPAHAPRAAAPAGVLFAEDFDLPPDAAAQPEAIPPSFTAADLAAAREAAFAEGRDLGLAEAAAQHEAALEAAARAVAAELAALRHDARATAEAAALAVAQLLLDALAALFPTLCARHGPAEASAVLRALLPGVGDEPALRLCANPRVLPGLQVELARLDPALAARTEFVPSELAAPGDIDMSWQQGGASRNAAALWAAVADALAPTGLSLAATAETADAG
jgi:flagellar assembly protein FliH